MVARVRAARRRARYVDAPVQRWLWFVVALEIMAVAASLGFLYWRLDDLMEANLYRAHLGPAPSIVPMLLEQGLKLLLLFIAANSVALWLATRVWARYVGGIVAEFVSLVEKTRQLDFSSDESVPLHHEVLSRAVQWRAKERERLVAIGRELSAIDAAQESTSASAEALHRLRRLLP
jgi:hypothetical protein